ncbi:MAG TPA: hypothetical protein VE991_13670, partial [Acidimicrobiales bacterium]|nr:hypothetical protein [Acidimicrobiales bacterium]
LLQAVAGLVLAVVIAAARRLLPALAGIGYLVATIGGLEWSVHWGLFGFRDSAQAPFAELSLVVEVTGVVVLAVGAALRVVAARRNENENERPGR